MLLVKLVVKYWQLFFEFIHHQLVSAFHAELTDEDTVSATDSAVSQTYSQSVLLEEDELDEELDEELEELLDSLLLKYCFFSIDLS